MDLINFSLLVGALVLGVLIYALRIPQRFRYPRGIPRVPFTIGGNPFINFGMGPYDYEEKIVQKYPKLALKYQGTDPQIIITDPVLFKKVGNLEYRSFGTWFQDNQFAQQTMSLFLSNGRIWKDQRNIFNAAFTTPSVVAYNQTIRESANDHMLILKDLVESGQQLDLIQFTKSLTLQIICKAAFGVPLSTTNEKDREDMESLTKCTENMFSNSEEVGLVFQAISYFPPLQYLLLLVVKYSHKIQSELKGLGLPGQRMLEIFKAREMQKVLPSFGQQNDVSMARLISDADKRGQMEQSSFQINTDKGSSLQNFPDWQKYRGPGLIMELIQKGQIQGKNMNVQQSLGNLSQILVAGHETTATTMSYALYNIAKDAEIQRKVISEVDEFGRTKEIGDDDLNKFPYIKATIQESLRLYSPVVSVFRRNQTALQLDEFKIPKNSSLLLPIRGIHMAERYWPHPQEFRPERFLGDEVYKCKVQGAFFPFGYGPKICIGKQLAWNELIIGCVKIFQNFQVSLPKNAKPLQFTKLTTLKATEDPKIDIKTRM